MQITWENPEVTVKTAYILIGLIVYSLLGCHDRPVTAPTGTLTAEQTDQLRNINNAQADTLAAVRAAFSSSTAQQQEAKLADSHSDKMQKLIKIIQDSGNCAQTDQQANETYTASWASTWQVNGAGCPVGVTENKSFNVDKKTLTLSRSATLNTEFQAASGLDALSVQGKLEPGPLMNGKQTVIGHFTYDNFVVGGVGKLRAEIDVTPLGFDRGRITLNLLTPSQTVKAEVRWNLSQTRFRVNGVQDIDDAKTFNELFSSFQLLELLDRVKKMM